MSAWRGRSVFVTGAGGFIGSWLAKALVEAGATVTCLLRDQPRISNFTLLGLEGRVNILRGRVEDGGLLARALNEYECDTCFHLAAQAVVGAANRAPLATFETNIKGTWTLLEACRRSPLMRRVVVASSDKAYGEQADLPYTEDSPLCATYPYDVSKACADMLARAYHQTFGLPVAICRPANIYGGGDLHFSRLIPGTALSILRGEPPIVRSDGRAVRDYVFVDDAVRGYLRLGELAGDSGVAGQAFNLGSGVPVKVLDVVDTLLAHAGRTDLSPLVMRVSKPEGEIGEQWLSSDRAAEVLGWRPTVGLEEGLKLTFGWYHEHLPQIEGRRDVR
ncbi:MAG: GDP-mannose 4,6-dehydratase [Candidatus Rokubacteria bacterium]|nr:GDP-mannose 4,6-dehydratase [Candidatus Rokubacteria bacterium]